jgi:hypothetical protein
MTVTISYTRSETVTFDVPSQADAEPEIAALNDGAPLDSFGPVSVDRHWNYTEHPKGPTDAEMEEASR